MLKLVGGGGLKTEAWAQRHKVPVDHNFLPAEATYAAGMSVQAPRDEQGMLVPCRWNGERAIDWGLTNDEFHKFTTSFGSERCGDHKMLPVRGLFPGFDMGFQRLQLHDQI